MSTESTEYLFAVWAPDYPDALPRRLESWGGAMVDEASLPSSVTAKKMEGSVMTFRAASLEEVKSIIERDIYWTGNVWDKEKLQIKPFHAAKQ
ncbi:hypothetical protein EWM64_g9986 [Hericium alpestre]|uniref:YCII-related domain-containing protein n=1 Tax=Hericium alpestre TaxID=135208 RepID=A0A4Y9ZGZ6_9AGAM|nr:hypothetical protein EWM64_g9986 [Hericium alpestre]